MRKRICFCGPDNHLLLMPGMGSERITGEAVQQVLLARAFRRIGYSVSVVVQTDKEPVEDTVDGIDVWTSYCREAGLPVFRFFHPKATGIFKALANADADIYYQSPAGAMTGFTSAFCRLKSRTMIFRVASDANCIPGKQLIRLWRDRKLFEYGLRRATVIAVQTEYQRQLLKEHYGLESSLVPMALELPVERLDGIRDIDVLWISNLRVAKRPDRLLELARQLPNVRFTMVGGPVFGDSGYYHNIEQQASLLPNLDFLGPVPFEDVNHLILRSKILVNTSEVEGFPNTFLQAWARRVPVVSYFDPDGIIAQEGLGARPKSEADMRNAIQDLLDSADKRNRLGKAAETYALANFSPASAADRYIDMCEA